MNKILGILICVIANTAFAANDGGGGNGINGKPLESYIVDIKNLSAYAKVREQLDVLETKVPGMASMLKGYVDQKLWYFVPVALKSLPNETIGAPVLGSTEQIALQTKQSVWVDDAKFKNMSGSDQAKLIMHELAMALVMKNIWAVRGGGNPGCTVASPCDESLTVDDYVTVRTLTAYLSEDLRLAKPTELVEKVNALLFFQFKPAMETKINFLEELYNIFETQKIKGNRHKGFLPARVNATGHLFCRYEFQYDNEGLQIKFQVFESGDAEAPYYSSGDAITPSERDNIWLQRIIVFNQSAQIESGDTKTSVTQVISEPSEIRLGSRRMIAVAVLDDDRTYLIGIYSETYLYDGRLKKMQWSKANQNYPASRESITAESTILCERAWYQ